MSSPFPFQVPLVFGFLSVMLLVGVVLRAWVPAIQRFLIPACLIGGLLGLALVSSGLAPAPVSDLEAFAFHLGGRTATIPYPPFVRKRTSFQTPLLPVFPSTLVVGSLPTNLYPQEGFFSNKVEDSIFARCDNELR